MASSAPKGCLGLIGRIVGVLIILGVSLAVLRYLGQGAGLDSPEWFDNATGSVSRLGEWFSDRIDDIFGGDNGSGSPKKTHETPTQGHHPKKGHQ